jgi:hypothetical protein
MPLETTYTIIATIAVFSVFMAVLGWGYWYTRGIRERFPEHRD